MGGAERLERIERDLLVNVRDSGCVRNVKVNQVAFSLKTGKVTM